MTKAKSRIAILAQDVRKLLKREFPDMKFSVTTETFAGGCAMDVNIMSAPKPVMEDSEFWRDGYGQLNHYRICEEWNPNQRTCNGTILTQYGWETMQRVDELTSGIEGFHYFFDLGIGTSDKPFKVKRIGE